jgi:hypothetical protein
VTLLGYSGGPKVADTVIEASALPGTLHVSLPYPV